MRKTDGRSARGLRLTVTSVRSFVCFVCFVFIYWGGLLADTNAAASIALTFATEAAGVLGQPVAPEWAAVAKGLTLAVSDNVPTRPDLKGGYHPE